jgi:hypothetical protein
MKGRPVAFTNEEKREWREAKRRREQEPPRQRPEPVAECMICHRPFGYGEGNIAEEFAICDACDRD